VFLKELFDLLKCLLEIYKDNQIRRRVHSLKIAVFTVINTVHDQGGIIKIRVPEILAYGCPFINQLPMLFRQNKAWGLLLHSVALMASIEYILIMIYFNDFSIRIAGKDFLCDRMAMYPFFNINMGKERIK
jgi:hypothetical protein